MKLYFTCASNYLTLFLSLNQFSYRLEQGMFNWITVSLSKARFKSHLQAVLSFVTVLSTMLLSLYDQLVIAELKIASLTQMNHLLLSLKDFHPSQGQGPFPDLLKIG